MGRLRNLRIDPDSLKSVAEALTEVIQVVNSEVSFGDPLDPRDDQSLVLAGGTGAGAHNGRPSNIVGTWVELEFEALDTQVVAVHNLRVSVTNNEVNVRWEVMGLRHSGVGATGASVISVSREDADTLTEDSLGLRAYAEAGRTVNAANPIRVSLRFVPATRWPA